VLTTHKPRAGPDSKYENDWHHVREITERALAFMEKNQEKPFFCYIPHNSIHSPEIETDALIEKYRQKPGAARRGSKNPVQAAMLETMDKSVGTILDKIADLQLQDKTMVIFFSDNGQLGTKSGSPFRGSKGDLYEGGIRMPLIVRWPAVIAPGSRREDLVISNDLFPTLQEIAGIDNISSNSDGLSLVPLLLGSAAGMTRDAIYWHYPHYHGSGLGPQGAIRKGRYKLIEWYERSAFTEPNALELYDLEKDPGEQQNLAQSMPDLAESMLSQLRAWRQEIGAQEMAKNAAAGPD
jgi:arylsulfatase A-like enzyme